MSLRDYQRKRRFAQTPEPAEDDLPGRVGRQPIFVVQLHHATARHYDFRLEVDGALKSWAVPRGPSLRPGERRLAVEVEDHPLSYAGFAGDIPVGQYGAGHVDLFDRGSWHSEVADPLAAIAAGKLDFELYGQHLRGGWSLVRTRRQGMKKQWLLLKRPDAEARDAESDDLLDGSMRQATSDWHHAHGHDPDGDRADAAHQPLGDESEPLPEAGTRGRAGSKLVGRLAARRAASLRKQALALDGAVVRPSSVAWSAQLAMVRSHPPAGNDWLHETKWDGYRLLADLDKGKARLRGRSQQDWTARFPRLVQALETLPVEQASLDGELVALNAQGDSDFAALQATLKDGRSERLRYVLFDLPAVAGVDLTRTPLHQRKTLLESLLERVDDALVYSTHIRGHGADVFAATGRRGLEGIVSKRADSVYTGRRTPDWVKVKHENTDEFVIVGYTSPQGSRTGFGALLLASIENGDLRYVGRVGTGFDEASLRDIRRKLTPVATTVLSLPPHTPLSPHDIHWVQPQWIAEVAFRGWGGHHLLRQASFQRLREDKSMSDFETTAPPPRTTSATRTKRAAATDDGVAISHATRVVYPDVGISKGDVAAYYTAVARWILPGLVDRPLSVLRCPSGVGEECFFQKHHAASLGGSVKAVRLTSKSGGSDDYVYLSDLRGLLELVQMNTLEFHPWGARVDKPDAPDRIVFDLDPDEGMAWKQVVAAAREIRARLEETGLRSFVRTSGGKGLHVVVPFRRGPDWEAVKRFAESFAEAMVALHPLHYVATASKAQRKERIFIDWLRNTRGATSVASWSLRARPGAPVSMPLGWEELGRIRSGAAFDMGKAMRRAARLQGDPWDDFARLRQSLPAL